MTYRIEFVPSARRGLGRLPRDAQVRIGRRIDALAEDPRPRASKPLKGTLKGRRRLRVGDYRVIYSVRDDVLVVLVASVASRSVVYRGG